MTEELKKLIEAGKLKGSQAAALEKLSPGSACAHKSWGIGRVKELDTVFGRLVVDFPTKAGHSFELVFAAQSLQPLAVDHIAARKVADMAGLKTLAKEKPLELLRLVLASHGGSALADEIATDLSGSVIPETDWKPWWDATKRAAKKDGHFHLATKKTEPFTLRTAPQTHSETLVETFRSKHGLKEKLLLAEQWRAEQSPYQPQDPVAREMATGIADLLERNPPRHNALALEAIWVLVDFGAASPLSIEALASRERTAVVGSRSLVTLAEDLPATKFTRLLLTCKLTLAEWGDRLLALANDSSSRRTAEIMDFLIAENQADGAQKFFLQAVRDNSAHSEMLFWLAKNRAVEKYRPVIAPLLNPRFLVATITVIEKDAIDAPRRSRHSLREFLISDETLLAELLAQTHEEDAKQIGERVIRSAAIDEPTKRSILGRLIKLYPNLQALVVSASPPKSEPLYVSAESLSRRQADYDDLINKQLPENARQIAIARSYGDLRENHEFKSAKEQQRMLDLKRRQMENELLRARPTSFENVTGDVVAMGTRVTIRNLGSGEEREYVILGAWDSDLTRGIISYQTPIAKALLNKHVGDEADVEVEGQRHRVLILAIAPWKAPVPTAV